MKFGKDQPKALNMYVKHFLCKKKSMNMYVSSYVPRFICMK